MDFRLYARVLWRFRAIVAGGLVLALLLAVLSVVRVSSHGISYRRSELWSTTLRLLVTQSGFPEGRLYAQEPTNGATGTASTEQGSAGIPVADPARFNTLAILYAELATSDPIRRLMRRDGPISGQITATALRDDASGVLLPLIDLTTISTTPRKAIALADRTGNALDKYVTDQQRANEVPVSDRVVFRTVIEPRNAQIFQPRSKTLAIVVFFGVMLAAVGVAFLLENLRPRARIAPDAAERPVEHAAHRRSA
jgi:hypothetical protein